MSDHKKESGQYKEIEVRKIVPIAAKISAGKSKLLNVILNIDFLETKAGIGTKFVNILRYNPNIDQPRFFHLKIIQKKRKLFFYVDPKYEVKIGRLAIIDANKNINNKYADNSKTDYEDIFYMTELNENGFIDKEYFLNHDLCDIPGLSEFEGKNEVSEEKVEKPQLSNEEEFDKKMQEGIEKYGLVYKKKMPINKKKQKKEIKENDNKEQDDIYNKVNINETSYLTQIFKILKNYIEGIIIVLSQDNFYFEDNFEIITKLYKVIQKDITNSLIILNKMDLSKSPENDIEKCKGYFLKYFPSCKTFNLNLNKFVALSAIQLQNELLMKKDYIHLLKYHFYNYNSNINRGLLTNNSTFINHLKQIILNEESDIKKLKKELSKISESENNLVKKDIKNFFIEQSNKSKIGNLHLGITEDEINDDEEGEEDDDDDDNNDLEPLQIMKIIYLFQKQNKCIPSLSIETVDLLEYFKDKTVDIDNNIIKAKDKEKNEITKSNAEIINNLESFCKVINENQTGNKEFQDLIDELVKFIHFLKIYNVIFIPFLGASNSGKTTIINGIIGKDLLPTASEECTKRGILIGYHDKDIITISKANFKSEEFLGNINYWFRVDNIIGKGEEKVKDTLKSLNLEFNKKEEDSFYLIRTRIKLFEDLNLSKSLKQMIYLIDFPGFGTGNIFEKQICNKVMTICNSFFFITKNSVIKENKSEQILNSIFREAYLKKNLLTSRFIKYCLFIFNNDDEESTTKEDLERLRGNIKNIINGNYNLNDINLCFFNAKYYSYFCDNYNYFFSISNLFKKEYKNYLKSKTLFYKTPGANNTNKNDGFFDFFFKQLNSKLETIFNIKLNKIKKQKIDDKLEEFINKKFKEISQYESIDPAKLEKKKEKILKIISYAQEHFETLKILKDSNIDKFKEALSKQINFINDNKQTELKKTIGNLILKFDMFFNRDFSERKKDLNEMNVFKNETSEIIEEIQNLLNKSNDEIDKILKDYLGKIDQSLIKNNDELIKELESYNYKQVLEKINEEIKLSLEDIGPKIHEYIDKLDSESLQIIERAKESLKKFYNKYDLETKNLKSSISKKLGDIKQDLGNEIVKELKDSCEGSTHILFKKGIIEYFYSLISTKAYLNNILIMLKETSLIKLEHIFNLLKKEIEKYLKKNIKEINYRVKLATVEFTGEQKEKWKHLCNLYEQNKNIIMKINY